MGLPVLAGDAPHEESPAQIEPSTIILSPAGIFTVVPALIISFAPSATVRLPSRLTVPVQVSDVIISPEVVTALTVGICIIPRTDDNSSKATRLRLLVIRTSDMLLKVVLYGTQDKV
jgi:hypothetical protein